MAQKMNSDTHKDSMSRKYGGMTSGGKYIKPETHSYSVKYKKEQKMFNGAKREINRQKGKASLNPAQHDKNDFEGQKSYKHEDT